MLLLQWIPTHIRCPSRPSPHALFAPACTLCAHGILRIVLSADTWPTDLPHFEHLDASHGRVVLQITGAPPANAATVNAEEWPNCKTVVMVAWLRQVGEKTCNLELLSLDNRRPSFAKKKLSKRQKRRFANRSEDIMFSILGMQFNSTGVRNE